MSEDTVAMELEMARAQDRPKGGQFDEAVQTVNELHKTAKSKFSWRWYFLFVLAVTGDSIDIMVTLAIAAGVVTAGTASVIVAIANFFIGLCINILIFILAHRIHKKAKKMRKLARRLGDFLSNAGRYYVRGLKLARRSRHLLPVVNKIGLGIAKIRKSPAGRMILLFVADLITILNFIPFRFIAVCLAYRDDKKDSKEMKEVAEEASVAIQEIAESA